MHSISLNKLRSGLKRILQQVAASEEPILITWQGEALAEICPPSAQSKAAIEEDEEDAEQDSPAREQQQEPRPRPKPPETIDLSPAINPPQEARPPQVQRSAAPQPAAPQPTQPRPRRPTTLGNLSPPPAASVGQAEDQTESAEDLVESAEDMAALSSRDEFFRAIPQHPVETTHGSFASFGLSAPLLHCLEEIGFEHPTPIQAAVIPAALEGGDVIGLAQTGSGKTAAFCLPIAERLLHGRGVRGLILSPTREIAMQTKAFLDLFGKDHHLSTACLIGGVPINPQITALRKKPDILVATPGRLLDHARRRTVRLDGIEELVLDEADHMLDLGFLPQIVDVLRYIPDERRTMMFSATMPPDIERLAQRLLSDPMRVDILPEGRAAEGITHQLYLVSEEEEKKKCALALLRQEEGSTLVFIRRKVDAEWLTRVLEKEGHPVVRIHSDLNQRQRVSALSSFREGRHRILVATDIAARGLDVPRIQHVINYDLPDQVEDYIHRAGRTARGRLRGTVSSICTWKDKIMVREIEAALGEQIPRCTLEGVEAYVERKTAAKGRGRHKLPTRRRL